MDPYTDGLYAWAHVMRSVPRPSGDDVVYQYRIRSGSYVDQNDDWPEDQVVRIRACNGTASDDDQFGCTAWYRGRS